MKREDALRAALKRLKPPAKAAADKPAAPDDPEVLELNLRKGESDGRAHARGKLTPAVGSARTLRRILKPDDPTLTLMDLAGELEGQCAQVSQGDLTGPEELLLTQATTLNALFHNLTRLGLANVPEYFDAAERMLRLAFRAQGQSRATLETLAALKNPAVVFARQANVTTGPQQVNNLAGARENESGPNELLEHRHGERLDTRTQESPGRSNPALAPVAAIDRAANGSG
jgi:hypothetical protein